MLLSHLSSGSVHIFFVPLAGNGSADSFLKMPMLRKYFTFYKLFVPLPLVFLRTVAYF